MDALIAQNWFWWCLAEEVFQINLVMEKFLKGSGTVPLREEISKAAINEKGNKRSQFLELFLTKGWIHWSFLLWTPPLRALISPDLMNAALITPLGLVSAQAPPLPLNGLFSLCVHLFCVKPLISIFTPCSSPRYTCTTSALAGLLHPRQTFHMLVVEVLFLLKPTLELGEVLMQASTRLFQLMILITELHSHQSLVLNIHNQSKPLPGIMKVTWWEGPIMIRAWTMPAFTLTQPWVQVRKSTQVWKQVCFLCSDVLPGASLTHALITVQLLISSTLISTEAIYFPTLCNS